MSEKIRHHSGGIGHIKLFDTPSDSFAFDCDPRLFREFLQDLRKPRLSGRLSQSDTSLLWATTKKTGSVNPRKMITTAVRFTVSPP